MKGVLLTALYFDVFYGIQATISIYLRIFLKMAIFVVILQQILFILIIFLLNITKIRLRYEIFMKNY